MTILICTALLLQQGAQANAYDDYVRGAATVEGAGETLKPAVQFRHVRNGANRFGVLAVSR
jgi:hypothetical protein